MKSLLVIARWSESEGLFHPSGRPYLDLLLMTMGFADMVVEELPPEAPFDPSEVSEEFGIILIQGEPGGGRVRRSVLSSLGLSLGLDGDESDRLRVTGARPLHDAQGDPAGFAVKRRGRLVVFCERSIWDLRHEITRAVTAILTEEAAATLGGWRRGSSSCWMIEGSGGGGQIHLKQLLAEHECGHCDAFRMPDGDWALMLSGNLGEEPKQAMREKLGARLYAMEPRPLEEMLGEALLASGLKVAVAESCTGGMVFARLSSVAGSSGYLNAGFVTYANEAKQSMLDVPTQLLARYGAVSVEVATSMARNAQRISGSDLAVSVTGIAGPGGGTAEKPVGTVYLVAAHRDGRILEHHGVYLGNRDAIRLQSGQTALHLLRRLLFA